MGAAESGLSWAENSRSVHPVAGACGVDGLEGGSGALVEDGLGFEALVLVVTVGAHAGLEGAEVGGAELDQDVLARGGLIFTGEAEGRVSEMGRRLLTR